MIAQNLPSHNGQDTPGCNEMYQKLTLSNTKEMSKPYDENNVAKEKPAGFGCNAVLLFLTACHFSALLEDVGGKKALVHHHP